MLHSLHCQVKQYPELLKARQPRCLLACTGDRIVRSPLQAASSPSAALHSLCEETRCTQPLNLHLHALPEMFPARCFQAIPRAESDSNLCALAWLPICQTDDLDQLADLDFTIEEWSEINQLQYQSASNEVSPSSAPEDEPWSYGLLQVGNQPVVMMADGSEGDYADMKT